MCCLRPGEVETTPVKHGSSLAHRPYTLTVAVLIVMVSLATSIAAGNSGSLQTENPPLAKAPIRNEEIQPTAPPTPPPTVVPTATRTAAIDTDDGVIPEGQEITLFDDAHPALANLDPDLLAAIQQAATDADREGIPMVVTSGWRSPEFQQSLLDEAIITYGSETEALKWVLTPERSSHVSGNAIDIGYTDADYWLIENGFRYGLCQTYANEIWHFELTVAPGETCPAPIPDANA